MSENNNDQKPLNHITPQSILDKITKDRLDEATRQAILEEEMEEFTKVVNRLFSSEDGQHFLNKLLRYAGISSFDKTLNPAKLVEDRGRQSIWFNLVKPFLDKKHISTLDF